MMQMQAFRLNGVPPPLEKIEKDERAGILHRFTKANLKLNIPLEPSQAVHLFNAFIDCS
jgi:hypothetical protein